MKRLFTFAIALFFLTFLRLSALAQYTAPNAFPPLIFTVPIEIVSPDDGTNRFFVASQAGTIRVFPNNASATTAPVFLNLSSKLLYSGEQGLLGLAFHPNYQQNGYFYVNYVRNQPKLQTVISRFKVSSANPNQADLSTELILLTFDQPFSNHKGGKLIFGNDGYLYIATGDGGSGGDPQNNAQNRASLLGKILRINVDSQSNGLNYSIPADNPYVGNTQGFRQEIFAYGMRNPWKISVDKTTGDIWAGDVGQNAREEVDIIQKGGNYGWRFMEGIACYNPSNCDTAGLIKPVWDYAQASGAGRSITGGLVYRGKTMSSLKGKYIYGDFVSGNVWALNYNPSGNTTNELLFNIAGGVAAFGEDQHHEIYICYYNGAVRKIVDPLQPIIQHFTPANGLVGSTVTIQGINFSSVASENTVKFGETTAVVTAATVTSLTVIVPKMEEITLPISVTTHARTFTSATNFSLTNQDQIITFPPLPDRTLNDSSFVLKATASSGLPVVWQVISGPATLAGNTLTLTGAGTVTIRASQPGNKHYLAAADVEQTFIVNAVTGEEVALSEQISIYPNPARDAFTIRLQGFSTAKNASVILHNTFGQQVAEQTLLSSNSQMLGQVSISQFTKGIYLLRIKVGERVIQRKVLVE